MLGFADMKLKLRVDGQSDNRNTSYFDKKGQLRNSHTMIY